MTDLDLSEPCVLIIDDDESVRDSLLFLMGSVGLKAKAYSSAIVFLDDYEPAQRGCIISDVRMPGMSGLALQHELIKREALQPIIFITGHGDIPMAVEAVKNGASDFHTKPFRDQDLLDSIDIAMEANRLRVSELGQKKSVEGLLETLTRRERQVMDLVVTGKSNKVIADELHLSPRTIEVHRSHVMEKMQVHTLADLIKLVSNY